jgi:hypothetical protein
MEWKQACLACAAGAAETVPDTAARATAKSRCGVMDVLRCLMPSSSVGAAANLERDVTQPCGQAAPGEFWQ